MAVAVGYATGSAEYAVPTAPALTTVVASAAATIVDLTRMNKMHSFGPERRDVTASKD
jgi:FAD/FMN-containing dehydrogenase